MVKDIALEENGDIACIDGDFGAEESDAQHIEHILVSHKGEWRRTPLVGVGIRRMVNAPLTAGVVTSMKTQMLKQLELDGYTGVRIRMTSLDDINITAERD